MAAARRPRWAGRTTRARVVEAARRKPLEVVAHEEAFEVAGAVNRRHHEEPRRGDGRGNRGCGDERAGLPAHVAAFEPAAPAPRRSRARSRPPALSSGSPDRRPRRRPSATGPAADAIAQPHDGTPGGAGDEQGERQVGQRQPPDGEVAERGCDDQASEAPGALVVPAAAAGGRQQREPEPGQRRAEPRRPLAHTPQEVAGCDDPVEEDRLLKACLEVVGPG